MDAADHGTVSIPGRDRPLGGCGGVVGFRQRDGFSLGLDGKVIDDSEFGRWCLRGAWEVSLRRSMGEGRYNGKIVTYMKDTA